MNAAQIKLLCQRYDKDLIHRFNQSGKSISTVAATHGISRQLLANELSSGGKIASGERAGRVSLLSPTVREVLWQELIQREPAAKQELCV